MSNSPDHIENFSNFLEIDSFLDFDARSYNEHDESLFVNI